MKIKTIYWDLLDAAEAVLGGEIYSCKCLYWKNKKNLNNLTFSFKKLEKEEQTKLKASTKKETKGLSWQSSC